MKNNFRLSISILGILLLLGHFLNAQNVKDVDGNSYATISIGSQEWMNENLRVTHYCNGERIETKSDTINIFKEDSPKYEWAYDGNENLVIKNGRLYTWYVASDNRNVCPIGWHVPTNDDWIQLRKNLGLDTLRYDTAIPIILSEKGFSFEPGSKRVWHGEFLKTATVWWTSSDNYSRSKLWGLGYNLGIIPIKAYNEELNGYPIRCIKD